jgi:hypothetical protein
VDGVEDRRLVAARRRRQDEARGTGVDHDGDLVDRPQRARQHGQRLLQERQLVRRIHRPRHVDQEHQPCGRHVRHVDPAPLDADTHEAMDRIPRRIADFGVHRKRFVAARAGVRVREIVDQLLDAYGVFGRLGARSDQAAHVAVAGGVDVDGQGRERLVLDGVEARLVDGVVALAVEFLLSSQWLHHGQTR